MKVELMFIIHNKTVADIPFLKDKNQSIKSDISQLLKNHKFTDDVYIYQEGDEAKHVYFITQGVLGYTHPESGDMVYCLGMKGDIFGICEIDSEARNLNNSRSFRKFNAMVLSETFECLSICTKGLVDFKKAHANVYKELF